MAVVTPVHTRGNPGVPVERRRFGDDQLSNSVSFAGRGREPFARMFS